MRAELRQNTATNHTASVHSFMREKVQSCDKRDEGEQSQPLDTEPAESGFGGRYNELFYIMHAPQKGHVKE